jgi:hypothetical protein
MSLYASVATAQTTFQFTSTPQNSDFPWAGKTLSVEGKKVAENLHSTGKEVYFATLRKAENDIMLTYLSLNEESKIYKVMYIYITKEHSKDLAFGNLGEPLGLDINEGTMMDAFETETISEDATEVVKGKINGIFMRKFESKEAINAFKKFLKR